MKSKLFFTINLALIAFVIAAAEPKMTIPVDVIISDMHLKIV